MNEPLRIPLDHLRAAFDVLIRNLAEKEGDTVSLSRELFWSIPPDELYNPYAELNELTMGDLSESWSHIEQMLADDSMTIPYHLVWLAEIIRALGHEQTRTPLTS